MSGLDPHRDEQAGIDAWHMARCLELARQGRGRVEPNPLVGCVIARGAEIVAEGWHRQFGGPHAEVDALGVAGPRARGATLYVNLEPCCHHGKTPPCTDAVLAAGLGRVVVAQRDPFPRVAGGGLRALEATGIPVTLGVLEAEARRLNAPYLKRVERGRPWVIAKWAMTLDGRLATRTGHSQWISGEASRALVHELRGTVDAIVVGRGTVEADDPRLTARPPGPRVAARIVLDTWASLPLASQLVRSVDEAPVIVVCGPEAAESNVARLHAAGCEVLRLDGATPANRLAALLDDLGRRTWTNLLVEGGSRVLGSFFDLGEIDELRVFIAPKLAGGADAPGPLAGCGVASMDAAAALSDVEWRTVGDDLCLSARVQRPESPRSDRP